MTAHHGFDIRTYHYNKELIPSFVAQRERSRGCTREEALCLTLDELVDVQNDSNMMFMLEYVIMFCAFAKPYGVAVDTVLSWWPRPFEELYNVQIDSVLVWEMINYLQSDMEETLEIWHDAKVAFGIVPFNIRAHDLAMTRVSGVPKLYLLRQSETGLM
jgi:hypothetical protein